MVAPCKVISNDLSVLAERIQPFAPMEVTRRKMWELHDEYKEKVANLDDLRDGGRLSCPIHLDNDEVIVTGNGRNGAKKYECRKYHDPELTRRDDTVFRFSTFTSYEALRVYRDFFVEVLSLFATCGGTYEGVAKYLNISKHMVDLSLGTLLDHLGDRAEEIDVDDDLIVVYADFSSTRVSRSLSVIMGRIGDEVICLPCPVMNWMTAWNFVKGIKEMLGSPEAQVIFVTDGEVSWVDPIKSFLPDAVHVRQFHSENCRGLVYVHLRHEGKDYTVRCRWDAVLDHGEPSDEALRMRQRRKLEGGNKRSGSKGWTELSDDIFVWEGRVKHPRGVRRKEVESPTVPGATDEEQRNPESGKSEEDPSLRDESEGTETISNEETGDEEGEDIAPDGDGVKRIFRGKLEDALEIPTVKRAFDILKEVFGGHYITSNAAETLFNMKAPLRAHRTVKSGDAFLQLFLFLWKKVRKWDRTKIRTFFREEVVTMERIRRIAVGRRGIFTNDLNPKKVVMDAYRDGDPVVICYKDRNGRRTRRMIEPLDVDTDPYTRMEKIKAYCYLRNDERTFLADRITDAIPADTNLFVISEGNL
ncbi:hypothetical protein AKJ44_02070 [candidate division MSBL1 archaeon SCGC-AAA261F17]|uniref:WYL domain-containing protein n=1 Tax=candidate division MSBL1 archaeon SCGC-AAA261F17 TaxID=1698274 RepID=A0A133V5Y9_9EURY|nr:hypothetical protein AKJ44_02070 [candidate division MSBL1 archaeon SCGC-AAA261F17]